MFLPELVLKGILVGIGVSAPIGPIGILCINRSIHKGIFSGILTGLGAAIPNFLYALLAFWGINEFLNPFMKEYPGVIILSGIYIIFIGFSILRKKNEYTQNNEIQQEYLKDFLTTFLIMITNPLNILNFILILTGIGINFSHVEGLSTLLTLTGSIVAGAMSWWIFLSFLSSRLGAVFFIDKISVINKISGILITIFGITIILKFI